MLQYPNEIERIYDEGLDEGLEENRLYESVDFGVEGHWMGAGASV